MCYSRQNQMTYTEIRTWVVGQRDALNEVITALDRLSADPMSERTAMPVPTVEETVATVRAHRRVAETTNGNGAAHQAGVAWPETAAREAAVLGALKRSGGMAMGRDLLAAFVREPGWDEGQRKGAFRNTMTKLKAKGIVGRTGETWSLIGIEGIEGER